jgi:hypothetical protein
MPKIVFIFAHFTSIYFPPNESFRLIFLSNSDNNGDKFRAYFHTSKSLDNGQSKVALAGQFQNPTPIVGVFKDIFEGIRCALGRYREQ